jgi:hypothetical protein
MGGVVVFGLGGWGIGRRCKRVRVARRPAGVLGTRWVPRCSSSAPPPQVPSGCCCQPTCCGDGPGEQRDGQRHQHRRAGLLYGLDGLHAPAGRAGRAGKVRGYGRGIALAKPASHCLLPGWPPCPSRMQMRTAEASMRVCCCWHNLPSERLQSRPRASSAALAASLPSGWRAPHLYSTSSCRPQNAAKQASSGAEMPSQGMTGMATAPAGQRRLPQGRGGAAPACSCMTVLAPQGRRAAPRTIAEGVDH